ncbi:OB-fold nucleic acid binding domain-containing protein [Nocardioides sp.]|uniref:OB-fold nucleic acid binding domain-containing protein n=1 Tax=Nocardioides sp. TaxID=35761 RepID=UPI00351859FA
MEQPLPADEHAPDPGSDQSSGRAADSRGRLRRTLSRWANTEHQHARDLRREFEVAGSETIATAADRSMVTLRGTLRALTVRPRGGVPALEAELDDGTGTITIVWLGRRRIAGVDPGRSLQVRGRIGVHDGVRTIYNPRYELL